MSDIKRAVHRYGEAMKTFGEWTERERNPWSEIELNKASDRAMAREDDLMAAIARETTDCPSGYTIVQVDDLKLVFGQTDGCAGDHFAAETRLIAAITTEQEARDGGE